MCETEISDGLDDPSHVKTHICSHSYHQCEVPYCKIVSNDQEKQRDEPFKSWMPVTLRYPVLGLFLAVSVLLIVILEILFNISSQPGNSGGLAFAPDTNSFSATATFSYLYLPTILAVFFSMIWSWVDLDTKRLEPWFQLSNDTGATAENSVLLQYPFDFLPFIPIHALRKKHWAVFLAGIVMLLVFWIITPLQSAIFNTATVIRSASVSFVTTASLIALNAQSSSLSSNFLYKAYGISWLGEQPPPFTTPDFALLPFEPQFKSTWPITSEIWSTTADVYSTSLTCNPADVNLTPLGFTFSNGNGCSVSEVVLAAMGPEEYMINYIGYYDNPNLDWSLQNPNCTVEHANNFLALYTSNSTTLGDSAGLYTNITALFCQTTYLIQEADVKVNASDGSLGTSNLSNQNSTRRQVGDSFNITHFEYLLATGIQPQGQTGNYPDLVVLEQYPRLYNYSLTWPVSNMVGFAVALSNASISDFGDPIVLHRAFESAHKLLFASAFNTLVVHSDEVSGSARPGVRQNSLGAVIMVRSISIIVESALALIAAMTGSLWYYASRRKNNLVRDPASIADVLGTMQGEGSYGIQDGRSLARVTPCLDVDPLPGSTFHMRLYDGEGVQVPKIYKVEQGGPASSSPSPARKESLEIGQTHKPVRPKELSMYFGMAFITIIVLAAALTIILQVWTVNGNGIPLPSKSAVVLSIIENYLPTAFATLLEPGWVILNRVICLLQPFDELRKGNAKPETTLDAKYSSLPPYFVAWRAIRSRHFLLGAVCIVAASTNVLAVSLSGLINERSTVTKMTMAGSQSLLPKFSGSYVWEGQSPYNDHLYAAMSNLTDHTKLPPWIDRGNFYMPFKYTTPPSFTNSGIPLLLQEVQGSTTGFHSDLACYELSANQSSNHTLTFEPSQNATSSNIYFQTSHVLPDGDRINCTAENIAGSDNPTGPSALELMVIMSRNYNASDPKTSDFCSRLLVAGWVRANLNTEQPPGVLTTNRTFIACTPQISVAKFNVSIDPDNRILSSQQTSNYITSTTQYFTNSSSEYTLTNNIISLLVPLRSGSVAWHNNSLTGDWLNSLLGYQLNSSALVDPEMPVPDAATAIAELQTLYRQLFALLIGLNKDHIFAKAPQDIPISVVAISTETRLFISPPMFKITIILLTLHLIVAILYYTYRPKRFLPRMPTSIAAIMGYFVASRAAEDFNGSGKVRQERGMTYAYGRYLGTDGKTHVGIEQQRFVVPLESRNPGVKRRRWVVPWRKEEGREPKSWI